MEESTRGTKGIMETPNEDLSRDSKGKGRENGVQTKLTKT